MVAYKENLVWEQGWLQATTLLHPPQGGGKEQGIWDYTQNEKTIDNNHIKKGTDHANIGLNMIILRQWSSQIQIKSDIELGRKPGNIK